MTRLTITPYRHQQALKPFPWFIVVCILSTIIMPFAFPTASLAATVRHRVLTASVYHPVPHVAASSKSRRSERRLATAKADPLRKRAIAVRQSLHPGEISPAVIDAIRVAQQQMKADPELLLAIASKESGFNPKARNRHSSARGLLQFTNTTWLTVVRDFGARHGLAFYAAAIDTDRSGRLMVKKPRLRQTILALRDNPLLEAIMMSERLEQERALLELHLGHPAQTADLYFLHLLGPAGATHFLTELVEHPDVSSVETVGSVVKGNENLFIKDGRPLSVAETYADIRMTLNQQASRHTDLMPTKVISVADTR